MRTHYGVGVGYYGYGYRPWGPCRFGCVPPDIDRPRPELPIEPTPEKQQQLAPERAGPVIIGFGVPGSGRCWGRFLANRYHSRATHVFGTTLVQTRRHWGGFNRNLLI